MNKKKLISLLGFIICISFNLTQTYGLGINYGNSISWSTGDNQSSKSCCPGGQQLFDYGTGSSGLGKSGSIGCMRMDRTAPNISISGYTGDDWTNRSVTLDISTSDDWTGVEKVFYNINGKIAQLESTSSNTLSFTKEGVYHVSIYAEDKSTHESWRGGNAPVTYLGNISYKGNISSRSVVIKIDKSGPIHTITPSTDYAWTNNAPNLSFQIVDKYEGRSIEIKTFSCTGKPNNSEWLAPIQTDGSLVGSCDPAIKNCSINSNYSPNTSNCLWSCNTGYSKGIDNQCYQTVVDNQCNQNILPKDPYKYDKNDILVKADGVVAAYWTGPNGVSDNGNFKSTFNTNTISYSPTINECSYSCKEGYHVEDGKCVNNNSVVCCKSDFPLAKFGSGGNEVDCTKPENANNPACEYNETCGGYVKDVMKFWDINQWKYTDANDIKNTLADTCGVSILENSNGYSCNPRYYLVGEGTASRNCMLVPTGEWSGQDNAKKACTNAPANAFYTAHTTTTGGNNDCPWSCNQNFDKKADGTCKGKEQSANCTGLPQNASWNSVSTIKQTWNGSVFSPSSNGTYNVISSTTECRFKCNTNYSWNRNSCIADTKTNQACTGLPENASWNSVSSITQTWNGSSWTPSTIGSYNQTSSLSECIFKCNTGKTWNGTMCK